MLDKEEMKLSIIWIYKFELSLFFYKKNKGSWLYWYVLKYDEIKGFLLVCLF